MVAEHAANIDKPVIFAVVNAPTALISLYELMQKSDWRPAFIIGVPVGFVNVEAAKELILKTDVPHIARFVTGFCSGGSTIPRSFSSSPMMAKLRFSISPGRTYSMFSITFFFPFLLYIQQCLNQLYIFRMTFYGNSVKVLSQSCIVCAVSDQNSSFQQ